MFINKLNSPPKKFFGKGNFSHVLLLSLALSTCKSVEMCEVTDGGQGKGDWRYSFSKNSRRKEFLYSEKETIGVFHVMSVLRPRRLYMRLYMINPQRLSHNTSLPMATDARRREEVILFK